MEPPPVFSISSIAYLQLRNIPRPSTATTSSQSSGVASAMFRRGMIPAFATRTSSRPCCSTAAAIILFASSGFETSPTAATSSAPRACKRSRSRSRPLPSMSPATIRAPSAANSSVVARPMPIAAPVMTADFPSRRLDTATCASDGSELIAGKLVAEDSHLDHVLAGSPAPLEDGSAQLRPAQDLACGIEAGGAHDASAGVRGRAAEVEAADRRPVTRVAGHGTEREQLARGHRALKDVSAGEVEDALQVGRRQHLAVDHCVLEIRRVLVQHVEAAIGEALALIIPGTVAELVRRVLDEHRHQVLPGRRHRRIHHRGKLALDHGVRGRPPVLRVVERALDVVLVGTEVNG